MCLVRFRKQDMDNKIWTTRFVLQENQNKLEIKPCGFESTIRDMEAERYKDK